MKSPCRKRDIAVSEIIGTILLISIVVVAASIVASVILSRPQPQSLPALSTLISNQSQTVYITHNGGDPLTTGTYEILVDGVNVTGNITKTGSPTVWEIGDEITYTKPGSTPPLSVEVVYNGGSGAVVLTQAYFGV
ncbi:MAG: type IV pilin N-terminal domain-containing protein [Methanoregula sp.]|uniref:type IV pilin N-terminal domain-containing protein n=1 Tax=Methanoregula sp. TaxID=2052170 RepID=UPI003BB191DA